MWWKTSTATDYTSTTTHGAIQSGHKFAGILDRYTVSDKAIIAYNTEGRKIIIGTKFMSDVAIKDQVARLEILKGKRIGARFTDKQHLFAKSIVIKY